MDGTATISLQDYESLKHDSERLDKLERQIFNMCEADIEEYKKHMKEWEETPDKIGDTDEEIDQSFTEANKEAVKKIVLRVNKESLKRILRDSLANRESETSYLLGEMETEEFKQVQIELI